MTVEPLVLTCSRQVTERSMSMAVCPWRIYVFPGQMIHGHNQLE